MTHVEEEGKVYGGRGNIGGYLGSSYKDSIGYYLKTLNDFDSYGDGDVYVNSSYNSSTAVLTEAQMKSKAAFVGFDFDKVWTIDPTAEYPYPTLIEVPYVSSGSSDNSENSDSPEDNSNPGNTSSALMGDMNGDGLVDAVDASFILQYYAYVSTGGNESPEVFFNQLESW